MSIYDFKVQAADGSQVDLNDYRGQVLVIVNTASKWVSPRSSTGWRSCTSSTRTRASRSSASCNQFRNQDPGSNDEIVEFCQVNYGVTFPMMAKIDVNGSDADPVYQWLTSQAKGFLGSKSIKWNFTKFLVGRDGEVLQSGSARRTSRRRWPRRSRRRCKTEPCAWWSAPTSSRAR